MGADAHPWGKRTPADMGLNKSDDRKSHKGKRDFFFKNLVTCSMETQRRHDEFFTSVYM